MVEVDGNEANTRRYYKLLYFDYFSHARHSWALQIQFLAEQILTQGPKNNRGECVFLVMHLKIMASFVIVGKRRKNAEPALSTIWFLWD